jgi:D-beta-D-heptose 7-phosphate kinase/D-beta-D-heptose 1-phosphate adenosyltransferase
MIRSLKWVDDVVIFDNDNQLITCIASYQPDIMIKGSEYKDKMILGESYCRQIVFIDIDEKYSTSKIISSIINRG